MKTYSPTIYITSNAGVIVENLGKAILIDSLFRVDKNCPWPVEKISKDLEDSIINGTGIFQCIEALVFTHCHPDHFDEELLIRCIENNNIRNLILPKDNKYFDEKSIMAICNKNNCKMIFLEREEDIGKHTNSIHLNGFKIQYYAVDHISSNYSEVKHFSFNIRVNNKIIFVSGDAWFSQDRLMSIIRSFDYPIDIGFFNYYHFNSIFGRKIINDINPKQAIFYHLPFKSVSNEDIRNDAIKIIQSYKDVLPPCQIVNYEMEQLCP